MTRANIKIGLFFTLSCVFIYLISALCGGDQPLEIESEQAGVEAMVEAKPTRYGIEIDGYDLIEGRMKSGETMSNLMLRYGRTAAEVYRLESVAKQIFPLRQMRAGNEVVSFVATDSLGRGRVEYVVYERDPINYVVYQMTGDTLAVYEGQKPTRCERKVVSATIESSLWGAIMGCGMPYSVGAELESIYQWSVDFFGIQRGDHFTVIYDEIFLNDSIPIGLGKIQGAKFTQKSSSHYAIPFEQGGRLEFWEEDGASLRKQMLKAPLKYTRISSTFSNARLHPVLKVYRPHHGVDYAAPVGTPVYSVADGVVTYRANSGAGGNMVKIKHPNSIETGYLHLSRFANGVVKGSRVKQGDLIGYVGSTGISTGPHLDYRVWNAGKPVNPLTIPQKPVEPISEQNWAEFKAIRDRVVSELNGEQPKMLFEHCFIDVRGWLSGDDQGEIKRYM